MTWPTNCKEREEPTLASVWYSLTGSTISDEFPDWPADVFALTEVILKRSQVHRFVLSPLADAQGKTQWRAKLGGLPEPSSHLSQAIYFLSKAARAVASQNGNLNLDGLHISMLEDGPAEDALDRLARRVLRSTLEHVRTQ